jgi:hypothetical protein
MAAATEPVVDPPPPTVREVWVGINIHWSETLGEEGVFLVFIGPDIPDIVSHVIDPFPRAVDTAVFHDGGADLR